IDKLSLDPEDPRRVVAIIRADANVPVKTDTRAKLAITSLTGPAIIQLSGGSPGAPLLTAVDTRDTPQIQTIPSALQNITDTAIPFVGRMDQVLSDQNVAHIGRTIENIDQISVSLVAKYEGMQDLLATARAAARSLDVTLQSTNATLQRVDQNLVR